jgi:rhodanese-related sulfurtransferase
LQSPRARLLATRLTISGESGAERLSSSGEARRARLRDLARTETAGPRAFRGTDPRSDRPPRVHRTSSSAEELVELYGAQGITSDQPVIAYCRIGERSSHTWFVLKHLLGFPDVKNYGGSWPEWGNLVGAPVEKP